MANNVSTPLNDRFGIPRITPEAASQGTYLGSRYSYTPGSAEGTSARATIAADDQFIGGTDIYAGYMTLPAEGQQILVDVLNAKRGVGNWGQQEMAGVWADGIAASRLIVSQTGQRVSPLEALRDFYIGNKKVPGLGDKKKAGGGGGGGGYAGPVTQTRLTDPTTAESLLDTSLKNYLGRAATGKEKSEFLRALNRYEAENPTVTTPMGPGGSITTGGAQPTVFAEKFAQSQEGAAEYQAATTYLDSFLGALGNPVG